MRLGFHTALLCALLLVVAPVAASGTATRGADPQADGLDRTGMMIEIDLRKDGSARFTVSTSFALQNESDHEAFDRLAAAFESGESNVGYSLELFERASAAAAEATGRRMTVGSARRTSKVENGTGVLQLSFTWTNFAVVEGDRLLVGDTFNTTSGTWLPGLTDGQTLIIRPPPGYGVTTAPVAPRNSVLRWDGPETFEPGYFTIAYRQTVPPPTSPTPSPTPTEPPGTISPGPDPLVDSSILVGLLVLGVGALAVGMYALRRREGGAPTIVHRENVAGTGQRAGEEADGGESAETGMGGAATGALAGGSATTVTTAADSDEEDGDAQVDVDADGAFGGIDPELLSDEERVEYLLQRNGGRMKQANIVKETGWSNAKVSQLLSAMDDEDRIDKLRIGRENLISLPDEDVTDLGE